MVSKPLSCFYPLFTREENMVSSRKTFSRRHTWLLLQYVFNEHTLKLVTRPALRKSTSKILADENSASSLEVPEKNQLLFWTLWTLYFLIVTHDHQHTPFLSPRCPLPSRKLENLDPCDLVDEENSHRPHLVDSSHLYMNNPFLSRRELFSLWI
jgi:hypothetical protein